MLYSLSTSRVVRPHLAATVEEIGPYEHVVLSGSYDGILCPPEPAFSWNLSIVFLNRSQWNLSVKELTHFTKGN